MTRFTLSPAMARTKSYEGNITETTLILPFAFAGLEGMHPPEKIVSEKNKTHAGIENKRFIVSPQWGLLKTQIGVSRSPSEKTANSLLYKELLSCGFLHGVRKLLKTEVFRSSTCK
jgi:hypothetical protein